MGTADPDPVDPLNRGKVRNGASLCENAQEATRRRIIYSIALFPIAATARFLFRLTKFTRTFYALAQAEQRLRHRQIPVMRPLDRALVM